MILGAAISALDWLVTLGVRFSRKLPKPATDIPRVEHALQTNPGVVKFSVIGSMLTLAALAIFTPKGESPEGLPVIGLIAAAQLSIAGGIAYSGWLMKNSGRTLAESIVNVVPGVIGPAPQHPSVGNHDQSPSSSPPCGYHRACRVPPRCLPGTSRRLHRGTHGSGTGSADRPIISAFPPGSGRAGPARDAQRDHSGPGPYPDHNHPGCP